MADTWTRRLAMLALGALTLAGCDYGLGISPDPAAPGATITVTNADEGPACLVVDEEPELEAESVEAADTPLPVDIYLITDLTELMGGVEPTPVASVMADEEGVFEATFPAPARPGQHLVVALCQPEGEGPIIIGPADHLEPIDGDGAIFDDVRVTQPPLGLTLSDDEVEVGDEVVATFTRCQAENDLGFLEGQAEGEDPDPEVVELATDHPDLDVFVDGELVDTVEGDERYPSGTVDVVLPFDEVGEHEVLGVCTHQTFDLDLELLVELMEGGGDGGEEIILDGVSTAAVEYPIEEGPLVIDEATLEAAGTVTVLAEAVAPTAQPNPVVAQPTYAG
jgi:hypothetical protein